MFAPAARRYHPLGPNSPGWMALCLPAWAIRLKLQRAFFQSLVVLLTLLGSPSPLWAQGVELVNLQLNRAEGGLNLNFAARITLPKAAEDALQRGVPIYFVAEAQLLRSRWYWRDERVARVQRSWRVAYQPLTNSWRVGLGGLNQTFSTQAEALAVASSSANWKLAEVAQVDNEKDLYVAFNYRLDASQLPGPMQLGLGGGSEFAVGVERVLRVEP